MLLNTLIACSFFSLNSCIYCVNTVQFFNLFSCQDTFGLLTVQGSKLLRTFVCWCFVCMLSFVILPGSGMIGPYDRYMLTSEETEKLFFKVVVPFYVPTKNDEFKLYILVSTWCHQSF
jgi:hypothetical protein